MGSITGFLPGIASGSAAVSTGSAVVDTGADIAATVLSTIGGFVSQAFGSLEA